MATKQVIISDISGNDITDDQHARLVITDHPSLSGTPVELDVTTAEAAKLQSSKLALVAIEVYEPNKPKRSVIIEADTLNKLFVGIDLVSRGRKVTARPAPAARKAAAPRSGGPKLDYGTLENMALLHRGRVTEVEAKLVRENMEQASKNREAQTGKPIDWNDPKEKARYGLETS